ncbi:hypothetical protein ACIBRY_00375 [Streptomyces anulatus]
MPLLVRRCPAYVCACLRKAQGEFGDTQVNAYVSLSLADTEESFLTSNVTFCTPLPDVRPYIPDLEAVTDAAVGETSLEETGKIQAGEAGLRSLRKALEAQLGMEVDLSIIRRGGPFDNPPYIRVP